MREAYGIPFSKLCENDLEEIRTYITSAIILLEKTYSIVEASTVEDLLKLADDMIEYLKKEDH